jgi:hypothetical protein
MYNERPSEKHERPSEKHERQLHHQDGHGFTSRVERFVARLFLYPRGSKPGDRIGDGSIVPIAGAGRPPHQEAIVRARRAGRSPSRDWARVRSGLVRRRRARFRTPRSGGPVRTVVDRLTHKPCLWRKGCVEPELSGCLSYREWRSRGVGQHDHRFLTSLRRTRRRPRSSWCRAADDPVSELCPDQQAG